jgi:hypothetical protein
MRHDNMHECDVMHCDVTCDDMMSSNRTHTHTHTHTHTSMGFEKSPVTPDAMPVTRDPPPSSSPGRIPSLAASVALLYFSARILKEAEEEEEEEEDDNNQDEE